MTSQTSTREHTLEYLARFQAIIQRTNDINAEGTQLLQAARKPATRTKALPYLLHALLGIGAVIVLVTILNSVAMLLMRGEQPFIHYLLYYPIIVGIYAYGSWKRSSTGTINSLRISPARFTIYLFALILPMLLQSNNFGYIAIYQLAFVIGLLVSVSISLARTVKDPKTSGKHEDTGMISEHIYGAAASSFVYTLICSILLLGFAPMPDILPTLLVLLCGVAIGCLIGWFTYRADNRQSTRQQQERQVQAQQAVETMTALQQELRELNQEYIAEGMDQFPREYTDTEIIGALHSMIASGAVESVPEAIERYESESYLRSWEITRRELMEGSIARESEKERLNHALTLHRVLTEIDIIPESQ
ncbi:MAG: hypothetical protein Q4P78_08365 [Rothia sp. (in: high G+C Gram-positive bacteria)]|uniref:hypothetical protein n=1 Tax=Rothia sp. (in: high G+C Gram-positive bacteria) TaxID=1885016 RepID=UPI0026DFD221|nr:hypothetical protein [Rothia sp. (in: high G+C Gram-positive bacteria)]MDO5751188.1 hypothetical protein [Rothia sp. (in: high G+C Gram-positive bacteria)]